MVKKLDISLDQKYRDVNIQLAKENNELKLKVSLLNNEVADYQEILLKKQVEIAQLQKQLLNQNTLEKKVKKIKQIIFDEQSTQTDLNDDDNANDSLDPGTLTASVPELRPETVINTSSIWNCLDEEKPEPLLPRFRPQSQLPPPQEVDEEESDNSKFYKFSAEASPIQPIFCRRTSVLDMMQSTPVLAKKSQDQSLELSTSLVRLPETTKRKPPPTTTSTSNTTSTTVRYNLRKRVKK